METVNGDLELAVASKSESEKVEFKEPFDTSLKSAWLEILKDIVAVANSGGGVLLVGVCDDGTPANGDLSGLLNYDPADLTNRMFSYTGQHFSNFRIVKAERDGHEVAAIEIGSVPVPIVFTSPGNYVGADGKQKNAFMVGAVYFRHGAKSEPGTSDDLRQFIEREVDALREAWLGGIRKVVEAPQGSEIFVIPKSDAGSGAANIGSVRVVSDPAAPAVVLSEEDILKNYPFDYRGLTNRLSGRYADFLENQRYHHLRRGLESDPRFCHTRLLNPLNERTGIKRFYSPSIIGEFDKHYRRNES